ncbi:hypothetical protein JTE90_010137 [Oedothorax gibbosus]|uniref:Uncharacterized protein n=1 Tax=Oedothorax gibbosus TaxID=931172 RepID=A0AAV6UHT0_9ARAC|nr:hypothetical protein JTE90_010137 [Oedothorax gibbosus]
MWFRRDGNLQTMCLNVVVSRINILKSVPDVVHEKHIEYLRRAYSEELFKLITKRWYPNEYLVWLISPFWKNVHLPGLGFSSSDIISKFLCVGENIDSLHLDYSDSSPHFLTAMICCLPNITLLNLTGTLITDDILLLDWQLSILDNVSQNASTSLRV